MYRYIVRRFVECSDCVSYMADRRCLSTFRIQLTKYTNLQGKL